MTGRRGPSDSRSERADRARLSSSAGRSEMTPGDDPGHVALSSRRQATPVGQSDRPLVTQSGALHPQRWCRALALRAADEAVPERAGRSAALGRTVWIVGV